jgi:hypothetical protein
MSHPDPRNVCDGCGLSLDRRRREHVVLGPIVHARVWRRLADDPRERLCIACMYQRALERFGRVLALNDLRLCRWNLEWLDVFVDADDEPGEFAPLDEPADRLVRQTESAPTRRC